MLYSCNYLPIHAFVCFRSINKQFQFPFVVLASRTRWNHRPVHLHPPPLIYTIYSYLSRALPAARVMSFLIARIVSSSRYSTCTRLHFPPVGLLLAVHLYFFLKKTTNPAVRRISSTRWYLSRADICWIHLSQSLSRVTTVFFFFLLEARCWLFFVQGRLFLFCVWCIPSPTTTMIHLQQYSPILSQTTLSTR